ncbi:hypothetical protein Tco_0930201 [Tanacetum coccineum]
MLYRAIWDTAYWRFLKDTAYWVFNPSWLSAKPKYYIWRIVDVDMTYSSKSGNGLLVCQVLDMANVGHDTAYGMPWKTLMKMMTEAYCPGSEIKKLETELGNLTVKVERYVGGLHDSIQGSLMASKPKIIQEAIELEMSLMDQKVRSYVARQAESKRRLDNNPRDNHVQQLPYKRQNSKFHHNGPCTSKCANYKRVGHLTRDCRSPAAADNQRAPGVAVEISLRTVKPVGDFMLWEAEKPTWIQTSLRLSMYHVVIVCDEKIVRVPYADEVLIVRGDRSDGRNESRLNIISYTKTQKYMLKGRRVFLAHITEKKNEDKSEEKRLEDVPVVQDFPEAFPEDLAGVPPTRQVDF